MKESELHPILHITAVSTAGSLLSPYFVTVVWPFPSS